MDRGGLCGLSFHVVPRANQETAAETKGEIKAKDHPKSPASKGCRKA